MLKGKEREVMAQLKLCKDSQKALDIAKKNAVDATKQVSIQKQKVETLRENWNKRKSATDNASARKETVQKALEAARKEEIEVKELCSKQEAILESAIDELECRKRYVRMSACYDYLVEQTCIGKKERAQVAPWIKAIFNKDVENLNLDEVRDEVEVALL